MMLNSLFCSQFRNSGDTLEDFQAQFYTYNLNVHSYYSFIGTVCSQVLYVHRYCMFIGTVCSSVLYVHRYCMFIGTLCSQVLYVHRYCMFIENIHWEFTSMHTLLLKVQYDYRYKVVATNESSHKGNHNLQKRPISFLNQVI